MHTTATEPIPTNWTSEGLIEPLLDTSETHRHATATDVNRRLAGLAVCDIEPRLVPFLAAAGAEMALASGICWRFSTDDPPVALLRLIAKAGIKDGRVGGPHIDRLLAELD